MNSTVSDRDNDIIQKKNAFLEKHLLSEKALRPFGSQFNQIVKQVANKVARFSIESKEDKLQFEDRLWDAYEIIYETKHGILFSIEDNNELEESQGKNKKATKEDHVIWRHGNILETFNQGYEFEYSKEVDRDYITHQAIKYLQRPWMENELLEWIFVDSLIFSEVRGYGEKIKRYSPKASFKNIKKEMKNYHAAKGNVKEMEKLKIKQYFSSIGNKFFGFFIFPLFIAYFSYYNFSPQWAVIGSVVYFGLLISFLLVLFTVRFFAKNKNDQVREIKQHAELLYDMINVYEILKSGTISPKYFREKLYEASIKGAVWPSSVFIIVDHAIERNPALWNAPASSRYENL